MIGTSPRIPDTARPLVDALTRAGVIVGWDLPANDWLLIDALVRRCGVDVLVQHATAAWHSARTRPRTGRYFLPGWRSLPDIPASTPNTPALPAAVGHPAPIDRHQAETDAWFARALARADARDAQDQM